MKTIHVIVALGGGVGSGATPQIVKYLKNLNKKIRVFAITPFSFEGKHRMAVVDAAIEKIKIVADKIVILKNDDLIHSTDTKSLGVKEALKTQSKLIMQKINM